MEIANENKKYFELIKKGWDNKTKVHIDSEFYRMPQFLEGENTLQEIEMEVLKNVKGKNILHLQCHFGQDSISLSRMGAHVTACDLSSEAIQQAKILAEETKQNVDFICCNIYDLKKHLDKKFDIVFTSYGVLCWLPDLNNWANIISHFLKPKGQFIIAEFHPMVSMLDDNSENIAHSYFNDGAIEYSEEGTYADVNASIKDTMVNWNHSIAAILTALIDNQIAIKQFKEYSYSPYQCFPNMLVIAKNRYVFENFGTKLPLAFLIEGEKMLGSD